MCEWDRINYWIKRDWPSRESFTRGYRNILYLALVDRFSVILPPLHIKPGLMKQFVKALSEDGVCFKHIHSKRSSLI